MSEKRETGVCSERTVSKKNRPQFQSMTENMKKGESYVIVCIETHPHRVRGEK